MKTYRDTERFASSYAISCRYAMIKAGRVPRLCRLAFVVKADPEVR